jgi:hypothetical protein
MNAKLKAALAHLRKKLIIKRQAEMKALQESMDKGLMVVVEEAYRKYREELEAVEDEPTVIALRWAIFRKTTAYQRDYAPLWAAWLKLKKEEQREREIEYAARTAEQLEERIKFIQRIIPSIRRLKPSDADKNITKLEGEIQALKLLMTVDIENTGEGIFVLINGQRIAKAGAHSWLCLKDGWEVAEAVDGSAIIVTDPEGKSVMLHIDDADHTGPS